MGQIIDLFTKKEVTPETVEADGETEAEFVQQFREQFLGELLWATKGIEDAQTIEDLESFIIEVREQVAKWPRPKQKRG